MAPVVSSTSFIPGWVKWNYEGYERKPAYPEYSDIIATMADESTICGITDGGTLSSSSTLSFQPEPLPCIRPVTPALVRSVT